MKQSCLYKGVMDKKYSEARRKRADVIYRYKMRARIVVDAVDRYGEKVSSLLDLGSADGLTLKEINSLVKIDSCIGIEYSDELLLNISELPSNISIIKGDIMNFSEHVDNRTFDVVTALCVLEHLSDPYKAIREVFNVIRPGGIFIAVWPYTLWDRIFMSLAPKYERYHMVYISKMQMNNMLKNVGMIPITYTKCLWLPIMFISKFKIFNRWLLTSFLRVERMLQSIELLNWSFVWEVVIARRLH